MVAFSRSSKKTTNGDMRGQQQTARLTAFIPTAGNDKELLEFQNQANKAWIKQE